MGTFSDVNNTMSGNGRGDEAMFKLTELLINTAGWSLVDESDGSGGAITSAGPGANGYGNQDAYRVLAKPLTGVGAIANATEVGFQRGANDQSWKCRCFPTAGSSGGTNTLMPTSADQFHFANQLNTDTFQTVFGNLTSRYHVIVLDSAEGHGFNIILHNNGAASITSNGMVGMDPCEQAHPDDTHPWVFFANNIEPEGVALTGIGTHGIAFSHQPQATIQAFNFFELSDTSNTNQFPQGASQFTPSGDDPAMQAYYGRRGDVYKGRSTLWYWQGPIRSLGFMFTDAGQTNAYVAVGNMIARWNDTNTLIL